MATSRAILKSEPGIKRDGTKFEGNAYVDGQWVRFQRGLPRKIGGYKAVQKSLPEISRGLTAFTQTNFTYCHSGSASSLSRFTLDSAGNSSAITDRTPSTPSELDASSDNMWMFDYQYDSSSGDNYIMAHVAPNLSCSCNSLGGQIFYGSVTGTDALAEVTLPAGANCTGGIVSLHPYMFYYGSDGIIGWSEAGNPTSFADADIARVWGQKIIKGLPLRAASGSAPSGIFWAYDAVIRASFNGGATVFQFDVVASDTSIMSANSVVDYDGVFFWAGVDRFLMFNGVVREVPNTMNLNWFFDGLNQSQRSKVFAFKVPRYGEIWWCYPRGTATECTHAVIFNVREGTWYDTELPNTGRSAGVFSNAFAAPLLTSAQASDGYVFTLSDHNSVNFSAVQLGIVQAEVGIEPGASIFNESFSGRKFGDINNDGIVGTTDSYTIGLYRINPNNPTISSYKGYIEGFFSTHMLSDTTKYADYLVLEQRLTPVTTTDAFYPVWLHEHGVDSVDGTSIEPIRSYFELADMSSLVQGGNEGIRITRIEPDFIQSGPMTVQIVGRANARSSEVYSSRFTFPDVATTPQEQIVVMKEQRRELRAIFESNAQGGDYQMGLIVGHLSTGDKTMLA